MFLYIPNRHRDRRIRLSLGETLANQLEAHGGKQHQGDMTRDGFKAAVLTGSEAEMLFEVTEEAFNLPSVPVAADNLKGGPLSGIGEHMHVRRRSMFLVDGMVFGQHFPEKAVPILPCDDDQLSRMRQAGQPEVLPGDTEHNHVWQTSRRFYQLAVWR